MDPKPAKCSSLTVFKENNLNLSSFQGFSLNNYQIFLTLVAKLQVYKSPNYHSTNLKKRTVALEAKEFAGNFHIPSNVCYKILRTSIDQLLKTPVTLNEESKSNYTKINICSQAKYIGTQGRIEVTFTEEILPYLTEVQKQFTTYHLKDISHLGSIYSTRLYELIAQHKKTSWIVISVDKLRKIFGVGKRLNRYFNFKRKTFAHACTEINKIHKDLHLKFTEIKEGRKIAKIRFEFTPPGAQNLQEAPIEQIPHSQEIPVSDDKLVQTSFVEMASITEQTEKTLNSISLPTIPPKEEKQTPPPTKSLWKKIRSLLL